MRVSHHKTIDNKEKHSDPIMYIEKWQLSLLDELMLGVCTIVERGLKGGVWQQKGKI